MLISNIKKYIQQILHIWCKALEAWVRFGPSNAVFTQAQSWSPFILPCPLLFFGSLHSLYSYSCPIRPVKIQQPQLRPKDIWEFGQVLLGEMTKWALLGYRKRGFFLFDWEPISRVTHICGPGKGPQSQVPI